MPWRPLEGERFRKWNLAGAALNAAITWPISIVSMVKCSGAWPFILVAVWKLVFSATLTIMSAHATYIASGGLGGLGGFDDSYDFDDWKPHRGQFGKIWWWSVFYFFGGLISFLKMPAPRHTCSHIICLTGALVGFVGVVAIVGEGMPGNETLVWITVGFGVGVGLIAAFVALATCPSRGSGDTKGRIRSSYLSLGVGVTAMTVLFALYSDWALAAVAGDLVGTPTKDNEVLYYFYWMAKRFPMFSL